MKKLYSLELRGKRHEWSIEVLADPKHVEDWRADGLDVSEIENTIPQWYVDMGLPVSVWCFFQDVFMKHPF